MNFKRIIFISLATIFLFVGCTNDKEVVEFNKPAIYWYKKIAKNIVRGSLDKADSYYISLKSEHITSSLLPTVLMMLANAHISKEEYLLANYYLDEYNKRYGGAKSREYTEYMKLKSSFLGIKDVYKDQKLIIDSITIARNYRIIYPSSPYIPLVNSILVRLHMSQYLLNDNIASLYDRMGKPKASKIYKDKNRGSLIELSDIKPPEKGFIGYIFD